MKLSIVVPVYNAEAYLPRCIDSLLAQSLSDYELLFVDDGSPDGSYAILADYAARFPEKIRLFQKPNGGQASARNLGAAQARGEYLSFVDSDDFVEADCYASLVRAMDRAQADVLLFDACADYGTHTAPYEAIPEIPASRRITPAEYVLSFPAAWNKIFRTAFYRAHDFRFPEGIWYEDLALIPQMALYTDRLYYEKQVAYHYVQSANSTMRNDGYRAKWHDMDEAISILQTALAPCFPAETEYLCFMHYLYETSLRYYGARHDAEIDAIADWMRQRYPHWRCNPYVRERASRHERLLARLFYRKKYRLIRLAQAVKHRIRRKP